MRTLLVVAACAYLGLSSVAQPWGTVNFANKDGTGVDAPVLDAMGTRLLGAGYVAQLWAAPVGGTLVAVGDPIPFRTSTAAAGYWRGELRTIPGVPAGADAVIEVRAWRVAAGKTYEEAGAAGCDPYNGNCGSSAQLQIKTGGAGDPPSQPADLVGLKGFSLFPCPEPTTWALLIAGGGLLLIWRLLPQATGRT